VCCTCLETICQSVGISTVDNDAASKCVAQGKVLICRRMAWFRIKEKTKPKVHIHKYNKELGILN